MQALKCVCIRLGSKFSGLNFSGDSPYKINGESIKFVSSHSDLGFTIDREMKFHEHIAETARICNGIGSNILQCTLDRGKDFMINIFISHIRPKLEYGCQLWNMGYVGDLKLVERVQRRWTKCIAGLESLSYAQRLSSLNLYSMQGRLLRADSILLWKICNNMCAIKPENIFEMANSNVTRGHQFKIFVPRARLEIRLRFFSVRIINYE